MKVELRGEWRVVLDPSERGLVEKWDQLGLKTADTLCLPGTLTEGGFGDVPGVDTQWTGSIYDRSWFHDPELAQYRSSVPPHFPFWLTPNKRYVGIAWYEREITIAESWVGVPFRIALERAHWQTCLWVDGECLGSCNSLCVPHVFEHAGVQTPGVHRLTLRVDNAIREIHPGQDAHSITDHTQGNWNGVVGEMTLEFLPTVALRSVQLVPDFRENVLRVRGLLSGASAIRGNLSVQLCSKNTAGTPENLLHQETADAEPAQVQVCVATQSIYHEFELLLSLDGIRRWDEFYPALYEVTVLFRASDGSESVWRETHGFREFSVEGTRFLANGRALFLRGNVDCCVFPLTGYPPTSVPAWERYFRQLKASGFNHVRFHSWCPPKAAFQAADAIGFYLQAEAPTWPNHGVSIGEGDAIDPFIYEETSRILEQYGNHASLCMIASGNEPYGKHQVKFLGDYAQYWKARDNRQLYTGASVGTKWPIVRDAEFIVHAQPRGLPFESEAPHSEFDYSEAIQDYDLPFVSHEMGQFCVFPDFAEIPQYTGVFRAKNLEMFRDRFLQQFREEDAETFLLASGKLQLLCYKAEIEAALRTPALAGIQLLGANDFPGQGTALIGWLNAFYEAKPYVDFAFLHRFLAPTVILGRTSAFVYDVSETMRWEFELAHFGSLDVLDATLEWKVEQATTGRILLSGEIPVTRAASGKVSHIGNLAVDLKHLAAPSKYTLRVQLGAAANEWSFWVYDSATSALETGSVNVMQQWSPEAFAAAIEAGQDVMLLAGDQIENGKDVVQYFRPAFWNTSWFQMAPPHTLGLSIDSLHPVFAEFPTDFHSDFQWWELVQGQPVANLECFPESLQPMVRPIDTWFINRRLGLLFEFRVGTSRVLFCTAAILKDGAGPAAGQLYRSVLNYMQGAQFDPQVQVTFEVVSELFEQKRRKVYEVMTDEKPEELIPEIES